nr:hypothetical protein [Tanacetum cinerariifolium]
MRLLGRLILLGRILSSNLLRVRLRRLSYPHTVVSPTALLDSTPPTCHVEESEGSDTFGARSMSSDSTEPLSPDHPLTHTTPTLVPILHKSARMAVRVPPMMLPGLSTSMEEVAAMSNLALCKRFRSSYESSPSSSPLDIPLRKRYRGMSELVEDDMDVEDDEEGDDKEEDKEMKERDEGLGMGVEGLSLGRDEAVPGGQQRESSVTETTVGEPLGLGYGAQPTQTTWMDPDDAIVNIDVHAYLPLAPPVQTPPLPRWSSGSLLISPAPSIVHSHISSPIISLTVLLPIASPATAETEGFLTEVGARVETRGD